MYTDGVTESHGPGGMFGQERLVTAILGGRRGADLLDALLSEVVAFSNSPGNQDDITLLALDLAEPVAADDGCWASEFWTTTTTTATIDIRNATVEDEEFDHGHGFIADDDRGSPGDPGRRYRSLADRRGTEGTTDD